jgi:hypothetical protein
MSIATSPKGYPHSPFEYRAKPEHGNAGGTALFSRAKVPWLEALYNNDIYFIRGDVKTRLTFWLY